MNAWQFLDNFLITARRLPNNCLTVTTAWRLPKDWLATGWSLSDNCLMTAWKLPNDYLMTAWWLSDDCLMTLWWLPDEFLMTALRLPDDCTVSACRLPNNCLMTAWQLPDKCMINVKLPVIPHWRPKIQITRWNLPNQLKALNAPAYEGVFLQHQIFPTLISIFTGVELNFPG